MQRSTLADQILQRLDDVIGVWEENPDFNMGPDVTIEKLKRAPGTTAQGSRGAGSDDAPMLGTLYGSLMTVL